MKKCFKIIITLAILLNIVFFVTNLFDVVSNADYTYNFSADWTNEGDANVTNVAQNVMGSAITVIRIVGTGISIIMLTYVAIKYMSAAPTEKAEFKKSATAFVVGAIVLFATTNILGIIADFATTNIN